MNWTKFAYHSFLTVLLGVTLSVCSNVMETDDFEIEAIANSSKEMSLVNFYMDLVDYAVH